MQPHQQRVLEEAAALDIKMRALADFRASGFHASLAQAERDRLERQHLHMSRYHEVLCERISAFGEGV